MKIKTGKSKKREIPGRREAQRKRVFGDRLRAVSNEDE